MRVNRTMPCSKQYNVTTSSRDVVKSLLGYHCWAYSIPLPRPWIDQMTTRSYEFSFNARDDAGCRTRVVYVPKQHAKDTKSALEQANLLDKNFRMVPAASEACNDENAIAMPIAESFSTDREGPWTVHVIGAGFQVCPYSTKMGNRKTKPPAGSQDLTPVQQAVFQTIQALSPHMDRKDIAQRVKAMDQTICPKKLEIFGDDRTVVVPSVSFEEEAFTSAILDGSELENHTANNVIWEFWKQLVSLHGSNRIVRRGIVDPDSGIRQSGHRLVFPSNGIPETTGPSSPGWITVTEQGIKQSFDLTRVMFSRGNVSEKIRFGKLVQKGETVLDMYAGIGYYTLPALIHGPADRVVACEWNEHAVAALRYNVQDNRVEARTLVLKGDCRVSAAEHGLMDMFDRVSLGLLPSCEGGWETAVRALKITTGGWLHIHANVRNAEQNIWVIWMCSRISAMCQDMGRPSSWIVLCNHLERVKSFAPTVSHYVADVFVGDVEKHMFPPYVSLAGLNGESTGYLTETGEFIAVTGEIAVPSCALTQDGVLSQAWMR